MIACSAGTSSSDCFCSLSHAAIVRAVASASVNVIPPSGFERALVGLRRAR
jgi:hypothetical protein